MKTMTCKQLGGACDQTFTAQTYAEMAEQSKAHAAKMFEIKDQAHLDAMNEVMALMQDPVAMRKWLDDKKAEFEALPHD